MSIPLSGVIYVVCINDCSSVEIHVMIRIGDYIQSRELNFVLTFNVNTLSLPPPLVSVDVKCLLITIDVPDSDMKKLCKLICHHVLILTHSPTRLKISQF